MRRTIGLLTALLGLLLVAVAVAIGTPASATTADCPAVFTTTVTDRPDSGLHGDWAKDTFKRTTTVACLGDNKYQLDLVDVGTFTTIAGATSPGDAASALGASFTGQFAGGARIVVTSDVPPHDPGATSDGTVGSGAWASLLFTGNNGELKQWGWVYTYCTEQWSNTSLGNAGDVTGKTCETTSTTPPTSATTTSPPTSSTTTSAPTDTTTGSSSPVTTTSRTSHVWPSTLRYANCAAVRAAGLTTIRTGSPGYRTGLDSDHDGVACEVDRVASVDDLASTGASGVGTLLAVGALLLIGGGIVTGFVIIRSRQRDQTDRS